MASLPFVVVIVANGSIGTGWHELADVVVEEGCDALDDIAATVTACPIACTTLALLLRGGSRRSPAEGLVAESASYSTLQAGPEFAAWRARTPARPSGPGDGDEGPRVRVERDGPALAITLTRPLRRNALDAAMRDQLLDALAVAQADPGVTRVEWRGEGPSFCAGGDLDEFGSRADPASAHLLRLQRSLGRALGALADRTTAYVHGPCAGSGIELPAFAGRVVAHPGATFALPEARLGLLPGAGGTVSLPGRIGRLHTAWLALSGRAIDAPTALGWGLVDAVDAGAFGDPAPASDA
jgi:enoyl-CoA hydratase/carnithine racemase